jgi:hypothetical protein
VTKILGSDKSNSKTGIARSNFFLPNKMWSACWISISHENPLWISRGRTEHPVVWGTMENVREIMAHTSHQGGAEGIHTVTMRKYASTPHGTLTSVRVWNETAKLRGFLYEQEIELSCFLSHPLRIVLIDFCEFPWRVFELFLFRFNVRVRSTFPGNRRFVPRHQLTNTDYLCLLRSAIILELIL